MKLFLYILACCLTTNIGFTQFQRSYGTEKSELGWALEQLQTVEKGYLVGGYTSKNFIGDIEATLMKTDLDGNQIWSRVYGGTGQEYFSSVRQSKYFNPNYKVAYLAAGHTKSFGFGSGDALLIGVNSSGFPIFSKVYGGSEFDTFRCTQNIKDKNGRPGYISVGNTFSYNNALPGSNVYVVRTNLMGDITKATVIGYKGDQVGMWIEQTRDGGYIISGFTTNDRCANGASTTKPPSDIFIIKLKSDLTMEWNRILGYPKELDGAIDYRSIATCVKENKQGDFVITGYTNTFGINNSDDVFLLFMSRTGNFQRLKTYGTERIETAGSLQVTINSKGNQLYTIVGTNNIFSEYKAMLFQTDASGSVQWARNYGDKNNEGGDELVIDEFDKGFAFIGNTRSMGAGSRDLYLVETTDTGKTGTRCEKEIRLKEIKHEPCITRRAKQIFVKDYRKIEPKVIRIEYKEDRCDTTFGKRTEEVKTSKKESEVVLFPNPVNNLLTIDMGKKTTITSAGVFDIQGKEVIQNIEIDETGKVRVATRTLNDGVYIVKLKTEKGQTIIKRFFKK